MKKNLFYFFVSIALLTTSLSVFSLSCINSVNTDIYTKKLFFHSKISKTTDKSVSIEVINDFDSDDEQVLPIQENGISKNKLTLCFTTFFSKIVCNEPCTLHYFTINLSRIPRFSFLSLRVLKI